MISIIERIREASTRSISTKYALLFALLVNVTVTVILVSAGMITFGQSEAVRYQVQEAVANSQKMAEERKTYGKNVQAALKKVETATTLDGAQKATQELKGQAGPDHNQVVPIATDLLGGPSSPKLDTSGPSPSTAGTFDQGAIERVVATRKAGVKRTCLDRSSGTAASSKVTATVTIAPNGSVQNVATAGDDPVMAKCIEQQLRTWSFPAPGETKQVQIPFVFVRQ